MIEKQSVIPGQSVLGGVDSKSKSKEKQTYFILKKW